MIDTYVCGEHGIVLLQNRIQGLNLLLGSEEILQGFLRNMPSMRPQVIMVFGGISKSHMDLIAALEPPTIVEILTARETPLFGKNGRSCYAPTTHVQVQASQVGRPAWQITLLQLIREK